jgi:hypothetical protein
VFLEFHPRSLLFGSPRKWEERVSWFSGVNQFYFLYSPCMFTFQRLSCRLLGFLLGKRHTFVSSDFLDVELCRPVLVGVTLVENV